MTWEFHDFYWIAWVALAFGLYEGYAIKTRQAHKTFTHFYCRTFALFPHMKGAPFWRFRRFLGGAIAFWLLLHMLTMTVGGLF